jgi:hypothetical protein
LSWRKNELGDRDRDGEVAHGVGKVAHDVGKWAHGVESGSWCGNGGTFAINGKVAGTKMEKLHGPGGAGGRLASAKGTKMRKWLAKGRRWPRSAWI